MLAAGNLNVSRTLTAKNGVMISRNDSHHSYSQDNYLLGPELARSHLDAKLHQKVEKNLDGEKG